jgi:hypothetical protein
VERVFFAGSHHLLTQDLLTRRRNRWYRFDPASPVGESEQVDDWQASAEAGERWSTPEDRTIVRRRAG